jgi:lipid A ethanolaminephosphotransferase
MKIPQRDFSVAIFKISPAVFVWCFAFVNALVFHWPLLRYVQSQIELSSSLGIGVQLVLLSLSCVLMWLLLGFAGLLSTWLIKPLALTLIICNAIALYAIDTYQVILDITMMGNVWKTHSGEAGELFHPKVFLYVSVALLVYWFIVQKVQWQAQTRLKFFLHFLIAGFLGLGIVFYNASAWLWIDKHSKVVGGLLLPWSYTLNSVRHFQSQQEAKRSFEKLPDLIWSDKPDVPLTVVLVIGESARAKNFQLYGYPRPTNPKLVQRDVLVMPKAKACSTYTRRSLECIFSHDPTADDLKFETLPNYLHRSGQVEVIWRTRNWGEPLLADFKVLRGKDLSQMCKGPSCLTPDHDEALLVGLEQDIANSAHARQFIVLHQSGSHGPSYHSKYPAQFAKFMPVCNSVDLKACSPDSLVNAYDNTIVYTDHFLDKLIAVLEQKKNRNIVMMYLSDHGESLGEGGWYLHGAPEMVAPNEQKDIPFLVWRSPSISHKFSINTKRLDAQSSHHADRILQNGHFQVFHSVMGVLGGRSSVYLPNQDIFNHQGGLK